MKPKNFPARKLKRQIGARLRAEGNTIAYEDERKQVEAARQVKSKKRRASL